MTDAGPNYLHLNSRGLPDRDRIELLREVFNRQILRFEWEPYEGALEFDAGLRAIGDLKIAHGRAVGTGRRTPEMLQDGIDDILVCINVRCRGWAEQRGKGYLVAEGSAFFGACSDRMAIMQQDDPSALSGPPLAIGLRLSRAAIAHLVPDVEDRISTLITSDNPALRLLVHYVNALNSNGFSEPEAARFAAPHIEDLVALAIGASRDGTVAASRRGLSAARLLAVKQDIAGLIGPRKISAELLGRRHGLSPRYVRMLFETVGESLWAHVLQTQLERAFERLGTPAGGAVPISDIAYDVGFSDLSYFNRTFRARFGMTPSDAREIGFRRRSNQDISIKSKP